MLLRLKRDATPNGNTVTGPTAPVVPFKVLAREFLVLGTTAFGGPAMIGQIRKRMVQKSRWVTDDQFKDGVSLAQIIPGATAFQIVSFCGYAIRGMAGALTAACSFIFPPFVLMLLLSALYVRFGALPWLIPLLTGLRSFVVGLMAWSAFRMWRTMCNIKRPATYIVAVASFAGFIAGPNYLSVVLGAGVLYIVINLVFPDRTGQSAQAALPVAAHWKQFGILWASLGVIAGIFVLFMVYGSRLGILGLTLMKIDFLAVGGGWAAVPLMNQAFVANNRWLTQYQFLDGLMFGQLTPGPIVITATFIGYIVSGWSGALLATVAMLAPSFIMVTSLAPFLARIKRNRFLKSFLTGAGLSLAGMLAYLVVKLYPASIVDVKTFVIAVLALILLLFRVNIFYLIAGAIPLSYILFR